jgi:uncharacterized repeat protein (TIGR03899 family)
MEVKDLVGLSAPLTKLIEVVSEGVGGLSKAYLIRKTADAKAYEIKIISQAIRENQDDLKTIGFEHEKLSLISLDKDSLKDSLSLENRTHRRVEFKELKRQKNIESITQKAAESLESESEVSDIPINEDWTSRFFDYAEDISSEDMQGLWGRILAGEIKKPKSYSLRTLDILRNLSTEEAEIFIKFGSLAVLTSGGSFVLDFNSEELPEEEYQLKFTQRLLLVELGLLAATDLRFSLDETTDEPKQYVFRVGSTIVVHDKLASKAQKALPILLFTKIGQELLQLIKVEAKPKKEYLQLLATKLDRSNGPIKYAEIIENLPDVGIHHKPLVDIPLTDKEIEAKEAEDKAAK